MTLEYRPPKKVMCEACGFVFETTWTDEEAAAEFARVYKEPLPPPGQRVVICDACHMKLMTLKGLGLL